MPHQIFIVEDHPAMREAYASVLALEPDLHLTGQAASAEEALRVLESVPCDLVVTDMMLPGMSGVDLIERVHQTRPALPMLVISGHEEDLYAQRARDAGAVGFLPKSNLARTLADAIRDILGPNGQDGGPRPDGRADGRAA